jgi:hypothetical protein
VCRDRVDQVCELPAGYGTKPGQKPLPPWGTLALQPGPRFQQIGDSDAGDGGESPIPDKSGTGTGERPRHRANRGPRPRTNRGRGRGRRGVGDRGVRALCQCACSQLAASLMGGLPGNLGICREVTGTARAGPRRPETGLGLLAPGEPGPWQSHWQVAQRACMGCS